MKLTWRDGVTALAAAGAIIVERAFFHTWDWSLVSTMRWTLAILASLMATGIVFSYVLDKAHGASWSLVTGLFTLVALAITAMGIITAETDFVVLLMLSTVLFGLTAVVRHLFVHESYVKSHA